MRMQLVPARRDPRAAVHTIGPDGLKLPDDRGAVRRDRGPDTRDDRIIPGQALAVIMHLRCHSINRHITTGCVDHLNRMSALFPHFYQPPCRIIILPAQHRNAQGPLRGHAPHAGVMIDVIAQLRLQLPLGCGDRDMIPQRLTAQEHPARHSSPVRQRDLNGPALPGHFQCAFNHIALFRLTIGRGHLAPVDQIGRTGDRDILTPRDRMHVETHLGGLGRAKGLNVMGMQG